MDYKAIQELIKTLSESKVNTLELESEGLHIKMSKGEVITAAPTNIIQTEVSNERSRNTSNAQEDIVIKQGREVSNNDDLAIDDSSDNKGVKVDENIETVVSPIVGTFYAASGPDEEDFVKIGSKVKSGDTLCIVEAMKLMNEISSEVNGEIVEILVNNEDMVEYGQPLFKIAKR